MNRKIVGIFVCTLLIATAVLPIAMSASVSTSKNKASCSVILNFKTKDEIFKEIEETENKILKVDKIIGNRYVKYWEHAISDVFVKDDSILLHLDVENGDILHYERSWTDVEVVLSYSEDEVSELTNYFWKQLVVFPEEDDCGFFYTFYDPQEYPLVCWEVRHTDGTTIMYDFNGDQMGYGIPAPCENGFLLSGDCNDPSHPADCWKKWRENSGLKQ